MLRGSSEEDWSSGSRVRTPFSRWTTLSSRAVSVERLFSRLSVGLKPPGRVLGGV